MNATLKWTLAGLALVLAIGAGTRAVSAGFGAPETAQRYEKVMWYFLPVLDSWATEVERAAEGVAVKPELEAQLRELAYRGEYMLYDLEGTPVPAGMQDEHERLLAGLRQYNEVAQIAAEDRDGAMHLIDTYDALFQGAQRDIRGWLMARIDIGTPVVAPIAAAGQ